MFTVEFEADASVITVLDESNEMEDVEVIISDDDVVFMRQWQEELGKYEMLVMTYRQLLDITASLHTTVGLHKIEVVKND
jgi:hypothetical protein